MKTYWQYSWDRVIKTGLMILPIWMIILTSFTDAFYATFIVAIILQIFVSQSAYKRMKSLKAKYDEFDYTDDKDFIQMYSDKAFGWFILAVGVIVWVYYITFRTVVLDNIFAICLCLAVWALMVIAMSMYKYRKYKDYHLRKMD